MQLTVKITDPVMYTQPRYPIKNFRLGMNSPDFDIRETICAVSQQALYNEIYKMTGEAPEKPRRNRITDLKADPETSRRTRTTRC